MDARREPGLAEPTGYTRRGATQLGNSGHTRPPSRAAPLPARARSRSSRTAPHSLRAVTLDDLKWAAASWPDAPKHIHVSEQTREVEDCLAVHGRRPIDLLMDTVDVDEHWCLVHATHADAGERARIAKAKAVVGLCPITEANLGDGLFEVPDFVDQGGRFGVGSDSNVRLSAADELRTLEYGQRLIRRQRNVMGAPDRSTGRRLFDAALAGVFVTWPLDPARLAIAGFSDGASYALSLAMIDALTTIFTQLAERRDVHIIVLQADGPAFCAGHDLRELTARGHDVLLDPEVCEYCLDFWQPMASTLACSSAMRTSWRCSRTSGVSMAGLRMSPSSPPVQHTSTERTPSAW